MPHWSQISGYGPQGPVGSPDMFESLLAGSTPGTAPGESANVLIDGSLPILLGDSSAYTVTVTVCVVGFVGGIQRTRSFFVRLAVSKSGGITRIAGIDGATSFGDREALPWTLDFSVASGPDRLLITFTTGSTTSATTVAGRLVLVEGSP